MSILDELDDNDTSLEAYARRQNKRRRLEQEAELQSAKFWRWFFAFMIIFGTICLFVVVTIITITPVNAIPSSAVIACAEVDTVKTSDDVIECLSLLGYNMESEK